MTTESFSVKFCAEVHADIDRGSLILVRTGQTQATLTPTNYAISVIYTVVTLFYLHHTSTKSKRDKSIVPHFILITT